MKNYRKFLKQITNYSNLLIINSILKNKTLEIIRNKMLFSVKIINLKSQLTEIHIKGILFLFKITDLM